MIITIDGPAGAGKTTVAKALAARLRARFLDTGAMYRAVALAGLQRGIDWGDPAQLAALAERVDIRFDGDRVLLDGDDVTEAIRTNELTAVTRHAADNQAVRRHLIRKQRDFAREGDLVTEGRDQGTLVFPQADCKIFLTASPEERARRRVADLQARGEAASAEQILAQQQRRDQQDAARQWGRLTKASDAVEVGTDGLSLEQVIDRLEQLVLERVAQRRAELPTG